MRLTAAVGFCLLVCGCAHQDDHRRWRTASDVALLDRVGLIKKGQPRAEVFVLTGEPYVAVRRPGKTRSLSFEEWVWTVDLGSPRGCLPFFAILCFNEKGVLEKVWVDYWHPKDLLPVEFAGPPKREPVRKLEDLRFATYTFGAERGYTRQ